MNVDGVVVMRSVALTAVLTVHSRLDKSLC